MTRWTSGQATLPKRMRESAQRNGSRVSKPKCRRRLPGGADRLLRCEARDPSMPANAKTRVLFFCESVTLAHVVRPLAFARLLPPDEFECHFACAHDPARHAPPGERWPFHELRGTITGAEFTAALA